MSSGASRIDPTRTTTALLDGLHDPGNELVWSEFDRRYRPIIVGFARKLGLDDNDAADAAQETLAQFVKEYRDGRYDRNRGRLRTWLIAILKTRIAAQRRKASTRREYRGDSAVVDLEDDHQLTRIWTAERRHVLLQEALQELREKTQTTDRVIRAFELFVINQVPAAEVAAQLDMQAQDVYLAKSRVAQRLRDILRKLEDAFEDEDAS